MVLRLLLMPKSMTRKIFNDDLVLNLFTIKPSIQKNVMGARSDEVKIAPAAHCNKGFHLTALSSRNHFDTISDADLDLEFQT